MAGGVLPLNFDSYFLFTLTNPNSLLLEHTFGLLSVSGTATAAWKLPPATNPALAGATLQRAYGVLESSSAGVAHVAFASNAVSLTLLP